MEKTKAVEAPGESFRLKPRERDSGRRSQAPEACSIHWQGSGPVYLWDRGEGRAEGVPIGYQKWEDIIDWLSKLLGSRKCGISYRDPRDYIDGIKVDGQADFWRCTDSCT